MNEYLFGCYDREDDDLVCPAEAHCQSEDEHLEVASVVDDYDELAEERTGKTEGVLSVEQARAVWKEAALRADIDGRLSYEGVSIAQRIAREM